MAKLVYAAIASLDGYTVDESGSFAWAAPDAEVHAAVNDLERGIGTYLYGRRMYDTMVFWETVDISEEPDEMRDYAEIWRAAEKVVYSRTLQTPSSERTRLEPVFDPEAVRELKQSSPHDLSIGGPELAGQAIAAGLVDEVHLFLHPISVGGGTAALPRGRHGELELLDVNQFRGGVVHLHYRVRN
ncbi:MAG TPA: dihydrofolate reductase family protein [Frankiaceae bacterium]|jgi:dihydrofolate reductase|nr:dihydrofolate reductase family protein [Frankiaceae bacterium]